MQRQHWADVQAVYLEALSSGETTFETKAPEWERWDANHLGPGRLVAEMDGLLVGWAALSPVSDRCAYTGVAEVSVYVTTNERGHGIGTKLMQRVVDESERAGIWTLQAGIFPENDASVAVHKKHEFRVVGRREKLGQLNGEWRDVLLLERRSPNV